MLRRIAIVLAIVVAVGGLLAAAAMMDNTEKAESYAYITKTNSYRSGTRYHPHDYCQITAQLPRLPVTALPADTDTTLLGSDALTLHETMDDDDACETYVHRWSHVTFDAATHDHVHFQLPPAGFTISRLISQMFYLTVAVFLIVTIVRDQLDKRRERRRRAQV
jgi:hypothetical protein